MHTHQDLPERHQLLQQSLPGLQLQQPLPVLH
jgi:hypothetical protein